MPRTLRYTDEALADPEVAATWLTQVGSGQGAWDKLDAIVRAIEGLRDHPCRWPLCWHAGVHELPCAGRWRALYEVDPDMGRDDMAGHVAYCGSMGQARTGVAFVLGWADQSTTAEMMVSCSGQ